MSSGKRCQIYVVFASVFVFCFVVSILREYLEMCESHSCACLTSDVAICLAWLGSCL
jgi:hypothetical protein